MKNIEQIMILEEFLEIAIEAGNIRHTKEIMDSLHTFYANTIENLDSTKGSQIGHLLINQNSGLSFFDELRKDYQERMELFEKGSDFYKEALMKAREHRSY